MKIVFLFMAVCVTLTLPAIGEGADKKPSKTPVESKKDIYTNSLAAPSLNGVLSDLLRAESALRDDPFDPNFKKNALKALYSTYNGKMIYIPIGIDTTGDQQLGSLGNGYQAADARFFISFQERNILKHFGYLAGQRMCSSRGAEAEYSGITISFDQRKLHSCSSDIGEIRRCNVRYDMAAIELGMPIDVARSLSGKIERFVVFDEINHISSASNYTWRSNEQCHDIDNTAIIASNAFTYYFRDKVSGRNVLRFRVK